MAKLKPLAHARKIKDVLAHYPDWQENTVFRTTNSHKWVEGTIDGETHRIRLGGKHSADHVEREQAEFLRQQIKKCCEGKCDCKQNNARATEQEAAPTKGKKKKRKK